jgi:sirohydrochlorin ferrochelatase
LRRGRRAGAPTSVGGTCAERVPATAATAAAAAATTSDRLGVVIVDHGSRRAASNDALLAFCDVYRAQQQPAAAATPNGNGHGNTHSSSSSSTTTAAAQVVAVEPAHMELAEPTIEQAVGRCVAAGARRVVVAPFFLSRGRHIQEDIPLLVEGARKAFPGVDVSVAAPLGADMAGLARILAANVERAAAAGAGEGDDAAAVVVAAGPASGAPANKGG